MTTEKQLVDQREHKILADDKSDGIYIDQLMAGARGEIERQLKYFRDKYAVDGVLSVSEMRTTPNQADLKQWQDFIKKYGKRLMADEEAKYRLNSAKKRAGYDRAQLLSSMVGISVAYATVNVNQYLDDKQLSEATEAMSFNNRVLGARHKNTVNVADEVSKRAHAFVKEVDHDLTTHERTWLRTDKLTHDLNSSIDRALQIGLDDDYYDKHLFKDSSTGNRNSVPALFSSASGYEANTLLRERKAQVTTMVAIYMAAMNHQKQAYWHNVEDNHVCQACLELTADSPFKASAIPNRPHGGCRCFLVYF